MLALDRKWNEWWRPWQQGPEPECWWWRLLNVGLRRNSSATRFWRHATGLVSTGQKLQDVDQLWWTTWLCEPQCSTRSCGTNSKSHSYPTNDERQVRIPRWGQCSEVGSRENWRREQDRQKVGRQDQARGNTPSTGYWGQQNRREAGWSGWWPDACGWMVKRVRGCVVTARSATEEQRERQGIKELMGDLKGQVEGLLMAVGTWQQWLKTRALDQVGTSASTKRNWEGRQRGQSIEETTTSIYVSLLSGFWKWAKETGQLKDENIWTDVKKGLKRDTEKKLLDKAKLLEAEAKADAKQDFPLVLRVSGIWERGLLRPEVVWPWSWWECPALEAVPMDCAWWKGSKTKPRAQKERWKKHLNPQRSAEETEGVDAWSSYQQQQGSNLGRWLQSNDWRLGQQVCWSI